MVEEITYPGGTRVLVWRLDEEAPELLLLCRAAGIYVDDLVELPVKRQREKAVERLLLCHALGRPVTLSHTPQGAPVIDNHEGLNISITHTRHLVALALNDDVVIGLDAEQTDREQVIKVRHKFLNASEQQFIAPDDQTAHIIAWTAKEAVIKAERNSAIDWTDGIVLDPMAATADETTLQARCGDHRYRLTCRRVAGHFITVALPTTG